jgi:hypothetical protein
MKQFIKQLLLITFAALTLSSCAQVKVIDSRLSAAGEVRVTSVFQYSFLTMNPLGNKAVNKGLSRFNDRLASELRGNNFDVVAEEAQSVALRNNLPVNTVEYNNSPTRLSGPSFSGGKIIPVNDVIASNRAREQSLNVSHRLILFPAMTTFHGDVGSVTGDVNWRLQDVGSEEVVAEGSIHYIADIRGFPDQDMATQLVQELMKLGVRGSHAGKG